MCPKLSIVRWVLMLLFMGVVACQPQAVTVETTRTGIVLEERVITAEPLMVQTQVITEERVVMATSDVALAQTGQEEHQVPAQRLIIKNGEMTLIVTNTDQAIYTAIDHIIQLGGYILNQQVYNGTNGYRYAQITLGVPVEKFEVAMQTLATLGQLNRQSVSGQDVTEEYVDLNSRLINLQTTQERLRTFLTETRKIEDTLKVNTELSRVEGEIEVIQGRISFLANRAAFSTITLKLNPLLPTPTQLQQQHQPLCQYPKFGNRLTLPNKLPSIFKIVPKK